MQIIPYTFPLLTAAAISAAVGTLAWKRRSAQGARAFSVLMWLVVLNVLISLFLLSSTGLESFLFWVKMSFLGGALGVAWLVFVVRFDGVQLHTVTRIATLVSLEPAIVFALAWFNDWHHLLWTKATADPIRAPGALLVVHTSFGPLFWFWSAYQYALLLAGFIILARSMLRAAPAYRGQLIAVLTALVVPWSTNILFLIGWTPASHVDLTPFAFVISGTALFLAEYRFHFLDLVPISRSLVLEADPNGVLVLDATGRIVDVNRAAESILNCTVYGVLGSDGQRVLPALATAMSGSDPELTLDQNGIERTYSVHVAPLRRRMGHLVLLTDITDYKQMSARLLQTQKMDALGLMAGGIAHDFNNLLTAILGNLSLAQELTDVPGTCPEPLVQAEQAARRAAELTHSLLAFSRNGSPSPASVALNESLDLTLQSISAMIPSSINIVRNYAPDLWNVLVDRIQLSQVVINLVLNARDAMDGTGTLSIRTSNVDANESFVQAHPESRPGRYVLLQVRDTGQGMTDAVKQHIFEPFFTTKRIGHGTGLGLAVVYGAVQQAGGWINVDTTPGEGTCFSTYLPECSKPESSAIVPKPRPQKALSKTVMIVDDEDMILQLSRRMLERTGYRVVTAASGQSAIDIIQTDPAAVNLVLLDMTMPGMTGDQVLWELRRLGFTSPIFISSGYSMGSSIQELVSTPGGADGFLPKPYSILELTEVVGAALAGRSSNVNAQGAT